MKLELETYNFRRNLSDYLHITLHIPIRKQLCKPHDPKLIFWDALREPIEIKLEDQIDTPIKNQLNNTPI